jgi:gluconate 2-dehydrogenase alpha chain
VDRGAISKHAQYRRHHHGHQSARQRALKYLQSWDCHNLFVVGANVFPHNSSYNPTGPVGALAYWTADAIKNRYVKNPGPLVQA